MNCGPRCARADPEALLRQNPTGTTGDERQGVEVAVVLWKKFLAGRGMSSPATKSGLRPAQRRLLRAVASIEFIKGIFVLLIGLSAILLVHKDAWVIAESLLALFHINTDRHSAQLFLDFADDITDARLWAAVGLAFVYSALRFVEAYGLWKQRTWAEWVAFGSGTLLIPLEIRELIRGVTLLRSVVFIGNLVVIGYMLYLLRTGRLPTAPAQIEPGAESGN